MSITFSINQKYYTISPRTIPIDTTLNTFIRNNAHLKGTKFMCLEGGCGACIVAVSGKHPVTSKSSTWAVNSCLKPIYACHGLDIMTVEGIGNQKFGFHQIQKRLANLNGSQCGYCSPGMVMNMYSLFEANDGKVTMAEIENSFGGNICRCTGYRSILDAFKTFASDADQKYVDMCKDIEDLGKQCSKSGSACNGMCNRSDPCVPIVLKDGDREWLKLYTLNDVFTTFKRLVHRPYILLAGNTAHGVYRTDPQMKLAIDITGIRELRSHTIGDKILLGGNVTLSEAMTILSKAVDQNDLFSYCCRLVRHIDLVANVPVRNSGTLAGNLSIKHKYKEFPSDIFLILESVDAYVTIATSAQERIEITLNEFLKVDMKHKIILAITLPPLDPKKFAFRSYKIMQRAQNTHAYVNAGFLLKSSKGLVNSIRICFGGISPDFVHAEKTEKYLRGKDLYTNDILQYALGLLNSELQPDWILPDACPDYRKYLAVSLFYKFVLSTCPHDRLHDSYRSGGSLLDRPISSGIQSFETHKEKYPLTQPVTKLDALIQCSGEAPYANDLPNQHAELYGAFVQGKEALGDIISIDAEEAMAIPGVVAFFSAKDIPGKNSFTPTNLMTVLCEEQIFADKTILYNGQPVGVIVANDFHLANYAATKVKINCYNKGDIKLIVIGAQSITNVRELYKAKEEHRLTDFWIDVKATKYGTEIDHTIKGNIEFGSQFHFTMEPQTAVCIPNEEGGLDVYCATQWMDYVQIAISQSLNIPDNRINMCVKRLGGGYGSKGSRSSMVACACALASHKLNRPVRFLLTLEANMTAIGGRWPCYGDYEIEVNKMGIIQRLHNNYIGDAGCYVTEPIPLIYVPYFKNCYIPDSIDLTVKMARTDVRSYTYARGPGTTEAIATIETIMEHIAHVTGVDPIEVRMNNILAHHPIRKHAREYIDEIDFYRRRAAIDEFNSHNRWKKKGIAVTFMDYPHEFFGAFTALVAIYHTDGTIAISHGGIEMGQGINTKVAQVAAYILEVPVENIVVKVANNLINPNASCTGASMTSEAACLAVKKACETLMNRIQPIREKMGDAEWPAIVHECYEQQIDLTCTGQYRSKDTKNYPVYGVTCAETEIDILTGNVILKRVDLLEDTGESLNPLIDIGQIEGAFIMGVGYWFTENMVTDSLTGELLTNRSWNYKPPGAKDIPVDFRVKFIQKSPNPAHSLRSKATGEPAICMSIVCLSSLRYALNAVQKDQGKNEWISLGSPTTPEQIFLAAKNSINEYLLSKT